MPSIKTIVFGGLALGGVVVATSYLTYKWYKYKQEAKTAKFEGTFDTALINQVIDLKRKVRNMAVVKPTDALAEMIKDKAEEKASPPNEEEKASLHNDVLNEVQSTEQDEPTAKELSLEPTSDEKENASPMNPQADFQIYVPKILQGMKSMKEFEDTLEALAAYLLRQERSQEELLEAQRELGWWWNLVVAFKDRVPKKMPDFENMLPLEDEDGMQSVD